jgi:hypothetical protein
MEAELRRLHAQVLDLRVQVSRLEVTNAHQARALAAAPPPAMSVPAAAPAVPAVRMVTTAVNTVKTTTIFVPASVPMISRPCAVSDAGTCTDAIVIQTRNQATQATFRPQDRRYRAAKPEVEEAEQKETGVHAAPEENSGRSEDGDHVEENEDEDEEKEDTDSDGVPSDDSFESAVAVSPEKTMLATSHAAPAADKTLPSEVPALVSPVPETVPETVLPAPTPASPTPLTAIPPLAASSDPGEPHVAPAAAAASTPSWGEFSNENDSEKLYFNTAAAQSGDYRDEDVEGDDAIVGDENTPPVAALFTAGVPRSAYALVGTGRSPLDNLPKEILQDVLYEYWKDYKKETTAAANDGAHAYYYTDGEEAADQPHAEYDENTALNTDAYGVDEYRWPAYEDVGENHHPNVNVAYAAYDAGVKHRRKGGDNGDVLASVSLDRGENMPVKVAAASMELRTDPSDGYAYTKAQFEEHYGHADEWDVATPWVEQESDAYSIR